MGRQSRREQVRPAGRHHREHRGIALLMVLIAVALVSLATLLPLRQQQTAAQREREAELLFVGEQYARAIGSYAAATPGGVPQFPKALEDLIDDRRFPMPRRHLRRLYPDPFTNAPDWTLIRNQGAVIGIASRSTKRPLKRAGFLAVHEEFAQAGSYADWKFTSRTVAQALAPAAAPPPDAAPPSGQPAPPPTPPARNSPADDRRLECVRVFNAAVEQCVQSSLGDSQLPCRQQARADLRSCMGLK